MKFLKIILILLIPAMGLLSCQKSDARPGCGNKDSGNNTEESSASSRLADPTFQTNENPDIVGSGDDDREGGVKKQRKSH